jgi:hypothetical protein
LQAFIVEIVEVSISKGYLLLRAGVAEDQVALVA